MNIFFTMLATIIGYVLCATAAAPAVLAFELHARLLQCAMLVAQCAVVLWITSYPCACFYLFMAGTRLLTQKVWAFVAMTSGVTQACSQPTPSTQDSSYRLSAPAYRHAANYTPPFTTPAIVLSKMFFLSSCIAQMRNARALRRQNSFVLIRRTTCAHASLTICLGACNVYPWLQCCATLGLVLLASAFCCAFVAGSFQPIFRHMLRQWSFRFHAKWSLALPA
jgi:hypothetical protein